MIFKTYQNYIIKFYLSMLFQVSLVFFGLILILNIFEEMNYIKDLNVNLFYPLLLTTLNSPSILYTIFPFIFYSFSIMLVFCVVAIAKMRSPRLGPSHAKCGESSETLDG